MDMIHTQRTWVRICHIRMMYEESLNLTNDNEVI